MYLRLDGEDIVSELESIKLNPTLDVSSYKNDERRSYETLEELGLSRDLLICTNLQDSTFGHDKYKNFQVDKSVINKNINLNPIPIILKELTSFLKVNVNQDFIFKIKNLSPEMKQSINGTCRIIFHKMQKELRKEFNSEQMKLRHFQNEEKNLNALNNKVKVLTVKPANEYTKKFHSNEKLSRENTKDSSEKQNPSSTRKTSESFTNKSLFVKVTRLLVFDP